MAIKLIVGLGNPGTQYKRTRHNVGFWFVDELAENFQSNWSNQSRFNGLLAEVRLANQKVFLLKPQTFMNRSGLAVGAVAQYYKIEPEEILVVHDELDIDAGAVKLKIDGGHAGHNGLRDIINHLSSKRFYRLRLGIGRSKNKQVVADYVLSAPSKTDLEAIFSIFDKVDSEMELLVSGDYQQVMNRLHSI